MSVVRKPRDPFRELEKVRRDLERYERTSPYDDEDPNGPVAPIVSPSITFHVREFKAHLEFYATATFAVDTANTCQADIFQYWIQIRPTDAGGSPKADGKIHDDVVRSTASPLEAKFHHVENPKKWYWQARYKIIDKAHRESDWGPWSTPVLPVDAALPKPPTPTGIAMSFSVHEHKHHPMYQAEVTFNDPGAWDIPGYDHEDDNSKYEVQLRACDSGGNPISGNHSHRRTVHDKDDPTGVNTSYTVLFKHLDHPKTWYYQCRVRTVDRYNRRGDYGPGGSPITGDSTRGWSAPQRATAVYTHPKPPAPSGLTIDYDILARHPHSHRLRAICSWGEVTNWVISDGSGESEDDLSAYAVEFRECDAAGAAPAGWGSHPHRAHVRAKNNDSDATAEVIFKHGVRKDRYYQFRVRSISRHNWRGDWSAWTIPSGHPTDTTAPPDVTGVAIKIHQHFQEVRWNNPADPSDADAPHPDIHSIQVQIASDVSFSSNVHKSNAHLSESAMFKVEKPGSGTWYARVRTMDTSHNYGSWVQSSNTLPQVTSPGPPTITFDRINGSRKHVRPVVKFSPAGTYNDDDLAHYQVQLQESLNNSFSNADPVHHRNVQPDDATDGSGKYVRAFHPIKRGMWCRARTRAIDKQGKASAWSGASIGDGLWS